MTMVRRLHREEKDEGGVRHLTKHPCLRTRIPVVSRVGDGGNPNPSSWPPLLLLPRAATRTGRRKVARPVGKAAAWLFPFFPVDLVGARPAISRRKLTGTPPPARQRWAPSTRSGFSPTGSGGCATGMRGGVGGVAVGAGWRRRLLWRRGRHQRQLRRPVWVKGQWLRRAWWRRWHLAGRDWTAVAVGCGGLWLVAAVAVVGCGWLAERWLRLWVRLAVAGRGWLRRWSRLAVAGCGSGERAL
jgi:hypothetical protein